MAYPFYPATYQPMFNPYQQQMPQQMSQTVPQQMPQMKPIQNGELIFTQSEEEARSYPVAPGNSVTFKNVNEPFFYTKTMGFSQLDKPEFKRYRVLDETSPETPKTPPKQAEQKPDIDMSAYALKSDLAVILTEFDSIKADFAKILQKSSFKSDKKKVNDDE